MQLLGEDRQLAGLRAAQLAIDADDVAQVEELGQSPVLLADLRLADEKLDPTGPVLDVHEPQLALVALQHDPTGRSDLGSGHFSTREPGAEVETFLTNFQRQLGQSTRRFLDLDFARAIADGTDSQLPVESLAPRVVPQTLYFAQLFAAHGFMHARRLIGRRLRRGGHVLQPVLACKSKNRNILVTTGRGSMSAAREHLGSCCAMGS